ncbi:MAG: OB-fold domain-containing protein [Promethearchaeota archaeon]
MIGIKAYGAYLPKYLMPREVVAKAWDFPSMPGTKAMASIDEDSITMGIEAGLDCLNGIDTKTIDGLFFATTTQVYTEKNSASFIAKVLDLKEDITAIDFTDSLKAGTTAVMRAIDTIKANKEIKNIIVIAADTREPEPGTFWEYGLSDGAAALLVAEDNSLPLSIEDYYSVSANVTGPWKRTGDKFIRTFQDKMDNKFYFQSLTKVMSEILKRNNLTPEDIDNAVFHYHDPRVMTILARMMKFPQGVAQNGLFLQIGCTGTPMAFMLLIGALRRPKSDAKIVLAGFGDGADAILLQLRDRALLKEVSKNRMGLLKHQKTMKSVDNYNTLIENKKLIEKNRYIRKSSAVTIWRETPSLYQLYGNKCKNCGTIQYPLMFKSCYNCRSDDQFEPIKLSLKGTVFTFTLDHLYGGNYLNTPVPRCVIDLDGGGRILLDMTDTENPEENVKIGMEVELTFRWVHDGANFHNYYWKCRPVRGRK